MTSLSFPRRQQWRHAARGAVYLAVAALGAVIAMAALAAGLWAAVLASLVVGATAGLAGCRALNIAGRQRVGADAEGQVRRQLADLRRAGWDVRHGVRWPGGGDIDHLLRAPNGVGFAIETKLQSFNDEHLARTLHTARWPAGNYGRFPRGVVPVLCVVRNRDLEHFYGEVLVVSAERLVPALRRRAGA